MFRKLLRFLFWVALVLGILIAFLRLTAIRWWRVPSNDPYLTASISPSLRGGDLILLWRLTKPAFSDLVLCPEPKQPGRVVIGRIAGVGRDELEITGADIKVNPHTHVIMEGTGIMGGYSGPGDDDEAPELDAGSPVVRIRGFAVMGGVNVTRRA